MGKAVETILKVLQAGTEATVNLMDALMVGHLTGNRPGRMIADPIHFKKDWAETYRHRQTFYTVLNRLKREGLVRKSQSGRGSLWNITKKGKQHLTKIWLRKSRLRKETRHEPQLPDKKKYSPKPSKNLVIVSFDIPEYAKRRRHWLRVCLISFGFKKLQKSVWVGNCGVPREFIEDLKKLEMLPWVHVFAATKQGTLGEFKLNINR